jgi:hypothetical protein
MSVTAVTSVLHVDDLVLNEYTNSDDVIKCYGSCLGLASHAIDRIHGYVTWLRSQGYRIHNEEELGRVKALIQSGFPKSDPKHLDNYARTFRALLSTEELPDKFSVTNSVQVASYDVGEVVDGSFFEKDETGKPYSYWLAGVVTNKRASTAPLPYEVFWLGYPPKKSGINRNPTWSSVHVLRRHIDSTRVGTDACWLDVENVRNMRIQAVLNDDLPKKADNAESHLSSSTDSASEESDRGSATRDARKRPHRTPLPGAEGEGASSRKNLKNNNELRSSARLANKIVVLIDEDPVVASKNSDSDAGAGLDDGVADSDGNDNVDNDGDGDDDDDDGDVDDDDELSTSDSDTPTLKPNPPRKNPPKPHPRPQRSSKKEPVQKQAPMSASKVEEFFWATLPTVTETCIDNLELLAAGKTVHADVEREGLAMLASRCRSLHSLYANQEFQEFLCIAQEALESYEGKQSPYQRKFMVQELKKFGFVITPRMWSKLELLMLMVIILDPKLMYMGIRQKDRKDERDQNR